MYERGEERHGWLDAHTHQNKFRVDLNLLNFRNPHLHLHEGPSPLQNRRK